MDEKRIDEINILNATYEAMNGAVNGLSTAPDFVLIDGNRISGMEIPHETVEGRIAVLLIIMMVGRRIIEAMIA